MICRLCLKDFEDVINIFDVTGHELNMAFVVGKHFWFVPRRDDPISTAICNACWLRVCDFHEFYEMVESAHRHMTERFIVKTENAKSKRRPSMTDLVNISSMPSKCEPDDDFDELGEVPFNMLIEDTLDEPGKTVAKAAAIALGADDSHDALSIHNFSHDYDADVDYEGTCDGKLENLKINNSNELSFDGGTFMKNILTPRPKNSTLNDSTNNTVNAEIRRSTRNSNRCLTLTNIAEEQKKANETLPTKKRRGRPKKCDTPCQKTKQKKQSYCGEKPANQDMYKSKMKEIDDQISQYMTIHCDICNAITDNFANLRIHMRTEHSIKRGYAKCCNKKFLKRALLLDHIRQHLDPECYRCEECERVFADRQSMRNHFLIKHQKEEDKIYECSECSKKFVKKYLLEQHKVFTHRDRSTTCKNCNRRYETLEELLEHNKEHCNYGTMCDICAKVIRGPAAFKRHQLEHQGVTFPKVQCDLCGSWHKDKYALNKHKKRHMESKQPHICDICHKVSPSRSAMLSHKRYVHGTERTYECGVCRKCFKKPLSLKEHMTTHTGEVLYRCPHCPKTFNSNANMHSHRKKVHPREFEEARKLRKQNTQVCEQLLPSISVLSNGKNGDQTLLAASGEQNQESHHEVAAFSDDGEVAKLTKGKSSDTMVLYSIN